MLNGYPQSDCEGPSAKKLILPLLPKKILREIDLFSEHSEKARLKTPVEAPIQQSVHQNETYVFNGIESPN